MKTMTTTSNDTDCDASEQRQLFQKHKPVTMFRVFSYKNTPY